MDEVMIYLIDDPYKIAQDVADSLYNEDIEEILQDPRLHTRRLEVGSKKGAGACGLGHFILKLQSLERRAAYSRFALISVILQYKGLK